MSAANSLSTAPEVCTHYSLPLAYALKYILNQEMSGAMMQPVSLKLWAEEAAVEQVNPKSWPSSVLNSMLIPLHLIII
jgi:hypothetical protein